MSERQKHGFDFQEKFIKDNNLIPDTNYTGEWDAYTKKGIPVQIKTRKSNGELDLGDLKRNLNKNENFMLVVGTYEEKNGTKNFLETKSYFVDCDIWKKQFNCVGLLTEMLDFVKNISNDHKDDQKWKAGIKTFKQQTKGIAVPRFKRDHKNQKRIQAAVPRKNLSSFYSSFKETDINA